MQKNAKEYERRRKEREGKRTQIARLSTFPTGPERGGGGGGHTHFLPLRHLTTDNISSSRCKTVPTSSGDTSTIWAVEMFLEYIAQECLAYRILFLFLVYRHLSSPNIYIAIVPPLLSHVPNDSMLPSSMTHMFPLVRPVSPRFVDILPLYEFYSPLIYHRGASVHLFSSTRLMYLLFPSGKPRSPTRNRSPIFFTYFNGPCRTLSPVATPRITSGALPRPLLVSTLVSPLLLSRFLLVYCALRIY